MRFTHDAHCLYYTRWYIWLWIFFFVGKHTHHTHTALSCLWIARWPFAIVNDELRAKCDESEMNFAAPCRVIDRMLHSNYIYTAKPAMPHSFIDWFMSWGFDVQMAPAFILRLGICGVGVGCTRIWFKSYITPLREFGWWQEKDQYFYMFWKRKCIDGSFLAVE